MKHKEVKIVELGTKYILPKWKVVDGKGIQKVEDIELKESLDNNTTYIPDNIYQKIVFVRGDKEDNGELIPRVDGILHEQLLGMMILDLKHKNELVPSREGSIAITKLQEALSWLRIRQEDREDREVEGTYKK